MFSRKLAAGLPYAFALFCATGALAAPIPGTPQFVWSNALSDRTTTYTSVRDPRDSSIFNGSYLARDVTPDGAVTAPWNNVQEFTSATVNRSAGATGALTSARVEVSGNAGDFDARIRASASSRGSVSPEITVLDANAGGRAGVAHWYVVQGPVNAPLSLRVDILFQGNLFAQACNTNPASACDAGAAFTHSLGLIASPDDLVQESPIFINGAATTEANPVFGSTGTVPDLVFAADGQVHAVNMIVRSNPFAVTANVPFRLNLALNVNAGSIGGGDSSAWIDFFDPRLVTSSDYPTLGALSASGFVIDADGNAQTQDVGGLEAAGFGRVSANVPLPGTAPLLGLGLALAGMRAARRRPAA